MITERVRITNENVNTTLQFYGYIFMNKTVYSLSTYPTWITETTNFDGSVDTLLITPQEIGGVVVNPAIGEYTYYFTLGGSPPAQDYCLILEVVSSLTEPITVCEKTDNVNLVWITREGGRASYIFDQRKDYGTNLGESKSYDNNGYLRFINRGKNFENKTVYKTGLSNDEVDYLESLKYSIQAWEYNSATDALTPIIINTDSSINRYSSKSKINEVVIKYRLATYKNIQNQ